MSAGFKELGHLCRRVRGRAVRLEVRTEQGALLAEGRCRSIVLRQGGVGERVGLAVEIEPDARAPQGVHTYWIEDAWLRVGPVVRRLERLLQVVAEGRLLSVRESEERTCAHCSRVGQGGFCEGCGASLRFLVRSRCGGSHEASALHPFCGGCGNRLPEPAREEGARFESLG